MAQFHNTRVKNRHRLNRLADFLLYSMEALSARNWARFRVKHVTVSEIPATTRCWPWSEQHDPCEVQCLGVIRTCFVILTLFSNFLLEVIASEGWNWRDQSDSLRLRRFCDGTGNTVIEHCRALCEDTGLLGGNPRPVYGVTSPDAGQQQVTRDAKNATDLQHFFSVTEPRWKSKR